MREPRTGMHRDADRTGILIVDDEPLIGGLLQRALEPEGFKVWCASGGESALELYKQYGSQIHFVLMDVQMPVMEGPTLWRALQQLNPHVRCGFMTGNIGRYSSETLLAQGAVCIVAKPFKLAELVSTLRRVTSVVREVA